ncbi:hypothetical protein CVU75_02360, partial [Candidatus Dependentiae bacterium HGW-Dependentiae-1]
YIELLIIKLVRTQAPKISLLQTITILVVPEITPLFCFLNYPHYHIPIKTPIKPCFFSIISCKIKVRHSLDIDFLIKKRSLAMKKLIITTLTISLWLSSIALGMDAEMSPKITPEQTLKQSTSMQELQQSLELAAKQKREESRYLGAGPTRMKQKHQRTLPQLELELARARAQYEKETQKLKEIEKQLEQLTEMRRKHLERKSVTPTDVR